MWHTTLLTLGLDVVDQAVALWGGLQGSLLSVGASANAVYRFCDAEGVAYLRVVHEDLRDASGVASGVDWARHLAAQGAWVAAPLPNNAGDFVARLPGGWLVTAWRGVVGAPLGDELSLAQLEAWGESLGRLHAASRMHQLQPVTCAGVALNPTHFDVRQFWHNILPVVQEDAALWRAYLELGDWLQGLPVADMTLTHGDFRPANGIWEGQRVWIVDFDEPTLAWPEYDLARACLRDEAEPFVPHAAHLEGLLRGYERAGQMAIPERVRVFVRLRALLMHAWDVQGNTQDSRMSRVLRAMALGEKTLEG